MVRTYVGLLSVESGIGLLGKRNGGHDGEERRREYGCAKLSKAQERPSPCGHDLTQISPLNHAPLSLALLCGALPLDPLLLSLGRRHHEVRYLSIIAA